MALTICCWCFCFWWCCWSSIFVMLLHLLFGNKSKKKKVKVSGEWTKNNNCGNANPKYTIRGFKWHLPSAVSAVLFFVPLLRWLFKNKRQTKMKLKVSEEWTDKRTAEALIINTPSGDQKALTLCCCCCRCSLFCAVAAEIVSIKTVILNF